MKKYTQYCLLHSVKLPQVTRYSYFARTIFQSLKQIHYHNKLEQQAEI